MVRFEMWNMSVARTISVLSQKCKPTTLPMASG